jgi:hypothetical protein
MSLVNQTIPGLYNGVSQQPHELRLDNQSSEMINCYPTVVQGVQKRLPAVVRSEESDMPDDVFVHSYDRGAGDESYIIVIKPGAWRTYDAETGSPVNGSTWETSSYLDLPAGVRAADSFSMVTVGDTTYLVNKTIETALTTVVSDNGDPEWDTTFFYWVKRTTEIRFGTNNVDSKGYTYYVYNAAGTIVAEEEDSDGVLVATAIKTAIGGTATGTVVRKTGATGYTGSDSWGAQASESWVGKVSKLQDLPRDLGFPGSVIEISGDDASNFDNYYVKFEDGIYKETFRPGLQNVLDDTTLPHKLERLEDATFALSTIEWGERKVGDEDNAPPPSFLERTLEDIFFYKNRLGLLSGDNVIMSETGEYYNFWPTTVTDVLDSDPIDVAVDSNKAVYLSHAIPFNKELLLFGGKAQFILSASKALSPKDINIQQSTAYTVNDKVIPLTLGPNVFFVTDTEASSIVREYYVVPDTANNTAANITAHCPSYIPNGLIKLTGSEKFDMLFAIDGTDNTIYVYNYYWQGEEKAQSAWHKWQIATLSNIFNIEVLNSKLLVMGTSAATGFKQLLTIDLGLPKNIVDVNYSDYIDTVNRVPFLSSITLSRWGVPAGKGNVDNIRVKLSLRDIKFSVATGSAYSIAVALRGTSKTYTNVVETPGQYPAITLYPSNDLYPRNLTYNFKDDGKFSTVGDVNNLTISFVNDTERGFKLDSMNYRGNLTQLSRNI